MYDFSAIKKAKENTKDNYDKLEDKFNNILNEALFALESFAECPCFDFDNLSDSMNLFAEAIELKKNRVEPYFYLSYIFYLFKDTTKAVNYLTIANNLNPNFNGLEELRDKINLQINQSLHELENEDISTNDEIEIKQKDKLINSQFSKINTVIDNYNENKVKAYSNTFKEKIYKLGLKF